MKLHSSELNSADGLIDHLCKRVDKYASTGDALRDRYVGFCAVTAAAHIETLVKEKVLDFCKVQNKYLYAVFVVEFASFNGRIGYDELRKLLGRFDKQAEARFVKIVGRLTRFRSRSSTSAPDSIVAYRSLLTIRHSFSHNINATFPQVTSGDIRANVAAAKRIASAFLRCIPR